jgi:hypothetical protein
MNATATSRPGLGNLLEMTQDVSCLVIEGGEQDGVRIPIGEDELLIGWEASGKRLAWDRSQVRIVGVLAFRDWSGIEVEALAENTLFLNGQARRERTRLRHGDRLKIEVHRNADSDGLVLHLRFEEPASHIILDSLLPPEPPTTESKPPAENRSSQEPSETVPPALSSGAAALRNERKYFGYFTPTELWLVTLCTPILTLLLFLALLLITQILE